MQRRQKHWNSHHSLYIALELSILNLSFWRLSGNDLYRGENHDRCRGLGFISKLQTFSTRVQRPSRERPDALTQEESVFSYGQPTLTTSVLVWEEPRKRSEFSETMDNSNVFRRAKTLVFETCSEKSHSVQQHAPTMWMLLLALKFQRNWKIHSQQLHMGWVRQEAVQTVCGLSSPHSSHM